MFSLVFKTKFSCSFFGPTGGLAAAKERSDLAEGWTRVAAGQTKLFEHSEKSEGPSRPASPDTARPEQSEGQPLIHLKQHV